MKLLLLLALAAITSAGHVLQSCTNSDTDGGNTLENVSLRSPIYLYVTPEADGKIRINIKDGSSILLRIVIECDKKEAKVSMKPVNTWTRLATATNINCDDEKMPIIINSKNKELWIGEDAMSPITYDDSVSGVGTLTVKGDVTVDSMAAGGNCIHFPTVDWDCTEANSYFMDHADGDCFDIEEGGGLIKTGFLTNCEYMPSCNGDAYSYVQRTANNLYSCTLLDGSFVGDAFNPNDVGDAWDHCTELAGADTLGK